LQSTVENDAKVGASHDQGLLTGSDPARSPTRGVNFVAASGKIDGASSRFARETSWSIASAGALLAGSHRLRAKLDLVAYRGDMRARVRALVRDEVTGRARVVGQHEFAAGPGTRASNTLAMPIELDFALDTKVPVEFVFSFVSNDETDGVLVLRSVVLDDW
jgi:hypothetical protein